MIKTTVGTKIGSGFALALVILVAIGAVCYRSNTRLMDTAALVAHTHRVLETLVQLTHDLVDAETGQRGYIITGEDPYLEPYHTGVAAAQRHLQELRQLSVNNSARLQRLDRLEAVIRERLVVLKEGIDARRTNGVEAGRTWVVSGRGKKPDGRKSGRLPLKWKRKQTRCSPTAPRKRRRPLARRRS